MLYRCSYTTDIEAETPEEAAREMFAEMRDPEAIPPIIEVRCEKPDGLDFEIETVDIDLSDLDHCCDDDCRSNGCTAR